jgi:hypothetical protein
MESNISAGVAAQTPPSVQPLKAASVTRGIAHFKLAYRAEGFPGAMIYSQNCYDSLTHKFSWAKLDTCGAFDMLAARAILESESGSGSETDYFQSEAAAGRFLAAATGGGEESSEADTRLSQLQDKAAKTPSPLPAKVAAEPAPPDRNSGDEDAPDPAIDNVLDPADETAGEE